MCVSDMEEGAKGERLLYYLHVVVYMFVECGGALQREREMWLERRSKA